MQIFNSGQMRTIAKRLITDSGAPFQFRHSPTPVYNPATGIAASTDVDYTFQATLFNHVLRNSGTGIGDMAMQTDDRKLIVLPRDDGVVPTSTSWSVNIDGRWWTVVNVKTCAPTGYHIYYEVTCSIS